VKSWAVIALLASGATVTPCGPTFAVESRSLTELLVEKGVITGEEAETTQQTVLTRWIDRIFIYGDLRLRDAIYFFNDNANGSYNNGVNENRVRFRFRLGMDIKMSD